ncbi:hypothetical protein BD309DRAFT_262679 [Dichomitus squalens]|nr:hypothetical protein BD309DRAFT_262679 [Dichomitus squalens]
MPMVDDVSFSISLLLVAYGESLTKVLSKPSAVCQLHHGHVILISPHFNCSSCHARSATHFHRYRSSRREDVAKDLPASRPGVARMLV